LTAVFDGHVLAASAEQGFVNLFFVESMGKDFAVFYSEIVV